ncbi:MAG TPA: hypothetical protein VHQ42_00010 [Candidatus Limnocylindria bacterium]|nr:hypothetical protein [Candidatus Limnocylindria bacterium]
MTSTEPTREPGYRGALPTRDDRLARPWLIVVAGIFVLIFVLSFLGLPSSLVPDPTPVPLPSTPAASGSVDASPSASVGASTSPDE